VTIIAGRGCGLPGDPNIEPLDMNQPAGSASFFADNRKFLTRKLWGTANEPPKHFCRDWRSRRSRSTTRDQ